MKYIIYCRKSTDTEDKQVLSLESQENELLHIATEYNLNVVKILKESKSAKEPGRPIFNQMVSMIMSGEADAILCWKIDRLTRNPVDGGQIQWLLQKGRIQCIRTFEKNYLPNDNVLIMSIEQAMANQYIRELSANVKRGNRAKLERGDWPNHAPFGYLNDKGTKLIIVDPQRSLYVRKMFEMYATGTYSLKQISDVLYEQGLRTNSGKKVFKNNIQRILNRPFYTGVMERDGKYYRGNHPPIISKQLYDEVHAVMHEQSRPRIKKLFFPIRGFLTCGKCGCALTATIKKGHHYYYCTNAKGSCDQHKAYIREKDIYTLVATAFDHIHFSDRKIELLYKAAQEVAQKDDLDKDFITATLERQLEALSKKESVLLDTFLAEQIDRELYQQKVGQLKHSKLELERQLKAVKANSRLLTLEPVRQLFIEANKAKYDFLEADDYKKHEIVKRLLWNLTIEDKKVAQIKFKSPYQLLANTPKNASFSELLAVSC